MQFLRNFYKQRNTRLGELKKKGNDNKQKKPDLTSQFGSHIKRQQERLLNRRVTILENVDTS